MVLIRKRLNNVKTNVPKMVKILSGQEYYSRDVHYPYTRTHIELDGLRYCRLLWCLALNFVISAKFHIDLKLRYFAFPHILIINETGALCNRRIIKHSVFLKKAQGLEKGKREMIS